MTMITMVQSESSWAFPVSCTADNSRIEHSSNGSLAQEVRTPGSTNDFAAAFFRET